MIFLNQTNRYLSSEFQVATNNRKLHYPVNHYGRFKTDHKSNTRRPSGKTKIEMQRSTFESMKF